MARPSKNALIDFSVAHDLTHGLLDRAVCPLGKSFVLIKDAEKKGLRLRVTAAGGKHWQFETRVKGKLFTRALGEWPTISISDARVEAHRLRGLTEQGVDPRLAEAERAAMLTKKVQKEAEQAAAQSILVGDVWGLYLVQGKLLSAQPKINEFIFAGTGKRGHIVDARASLSKALKAAGIDHLTLHGLRRAYKQRGRAVAPHGAVDQMQGHRPSGTADGYAILPLDDLRPFALTIERHILKLAGIAVSDMRE